MTPELTALSLAALVQVATFVAYSITAQRQVGRGYALSPRDTPRTLTGTPARLQRALTNGYEALVLFAIATLTVTYSDKTGADTALAAALFLIARILYVPAYVRGWVPGRSLIWLAGLLSTVYLLVRSLL